MPVADGISTSVEPTTQPSLIGNSNFQAPFSIGNLAKSTLHLPE